MMALAAEASHASGGSPLTARRPVMPERQLLLITDGDPAITPALVEDVLSAWPGRDRPALRTLDMQQIIADAAALDHAGVIWVYCSDRAGDELLELIGIMQDRHRCGLLTCANDLRPVGSAFHETLTLAPPATPPPTVAAMLACLRTASGILRGVTAELKLVQLHQGGLLDQIGKIDEELRLAAQLQREFLPHELPVVQNLDFGVFFRPAGYVSGDIYDVFKLDEEHVGFYVADAVGHGVPAALMTMFIKRSLPTKEIGPAWPGGYRIVPPDEALTRLNHDIAMHQNGKVRFATACYGVLNWRTLQLSFARGGHPFPFVLRAAGGVETLGPDGGLLGVFPEEQFELQTVALAPGDRLLLYSDGFELAFRERNPSHRPQAMTEAYTREFRTLASGSPDEALRRLADTIDAQAGSLNQRDDLTALLIGVRDDAIAARQALAA